MTDIIPTLPHEQALALAGKIADQIAGERAFEDYQERRAQNTQNRQKADLASFADYLSRAGLQPGNLYDDPEAWIGMTWGIVAAFQRWLLGEGYAVDTVNVRLSTIKTYARLAQAAGCLSLDEYMQIKANVKGYRHNEGRHIDQARAEAGQLTRRDIRTNGKRQRRKAEATPLTPAQAQELKAQPDTPQGRRDRLIMCLLLDHGLRVGELALLTVENFDLPAGELRFYRPKVNMVQTHRLTPDSLAAARAYLQQDAPTEGRIWRGSRKGNHGLTGQGMSARALTGRVTTLGAGLGIVELSAHDCRHYWATQAARNGTPLDRLQDAGGWSSLAMPARYIERAKIANQGVRLRPD
jgi:integrase